MPALAGAVRSLGVSFSLSLYFDPCVFLLPTTYPIVSSPTLIF